MKKNRHCNLKHHSRFRRWLKRNYLWAIALCTAGLALASGFISNDRMGNSIITLLTCIGTWVMAGIMHYNSSYDRKMAIVQNEYNDFKHSIEKVTYGKIKGPNALKAIIGEFKDRLSSVDVSSSDKIMLEREMQIYGEIRNRGRFYHYTNRLVNLLLLLETIDNKDIETHIARRLRDYSYGNEKYFLYLEGIYRQYKEFQNEEQLDLKWLVEKYHLLCHGDEFPPSQNLHRKKKNTNGGSLFYDDSAFAAK